VAQAGKRLEGEVVVRVKRCIDGAPVKLIISGKEKACLKARNKREQLSLSQAERRFFSVELPLRSFQTNQVVNPGVYTFPFAIKLPRSLPASDRHPNDKSKVGYHIQYRMTAKIGKEGKIHKEVYFPVKSAPLPPERTPCLIRPTTHRINSIGVKDEGRVVLGAMVNNSSVGRDENIELFLACRNDSSVNIRTVQIDIVEFLRWQLSPSETKDSSKILHTIKSVALPSTTKARPRGQKGQRRTADMYREIHSELRSRQDPILISVPMTAKDTYRGKLVHVWHCIKVTFVTRSVSNNATAIVPIKIGHAPDRTMVKRQPLTPRQEQPLAPPEAHPLSNTTTTITIVPTAPTLETVLEQEAPILASVPEQEDVEAGGLFPVMIAPEDLMVLGSNSVRRRNDSSTDSSSVVSAPPPIAPSHQQEVSFKELLNRMASTTSDFDLILNLLMERRWALMFGALAPAEFGIILSKVKIEVDHPRVAVMLAPHMNGGRGLTCKYAAAAVRSCSVSYRSVTTKRLLPMCVDIEQHYRLILNELNEWERIATSNEFEEALLAASIQQ